MLTGITDACLPLAAVQKSSGTFVVSYMLVHTHGFSMCKVSANGSTVIHAYASPSALSSPGSLAVDKSGFVYVADAANYRLLMLTPDLSTICLELIYDSFTAMPRSLSYDRKSEVLVVGLSTARLCGDVRVYQVYDS